MHFVEFEASIRLSPSLSGTLFCDTVGLSLFWYKIVHKQIFNGLQVKPLTELPVRAGGH